MRAYRRAMTPHRSLISVAALATTLLVLAGCGSGGDKPAPSPQPSQPASSARDAVAIDNFKFVPATLSVKQGARITVTNDDSATHTATADGGGFDTGNLSQGASKTITLSKPGRYAYHCEIHPFMKGTIVVK
jgi:plastocyanin